MTTDHGAGRRRAVVVGASLAGLLTAQVLSRFFDQVVVFDRDELPATPQRRRGVPQAHQVHGLLPAGVDAIDGLIDGFRAGMGAAGALFGDVGEDVHWFNDGRLIHPHTSGLIAMSAPRELTEHVVRQRVAALGNVEIIGGSTVAGLLTTADHGRVVGVAAGGPGAALGADADLVVDAGGRATRAPVWLTALGYRAADEDVVEVGITSVSRRYRATGTHLDGRIGGTSAAYPGQPHSGIVLNQGDGTWLLSLNGWFGEAPPTAVDEFAAHAGLVDNPDLEDVARGAEPIGEASLIRFPRAVRRRYADLTARPAGFLVLGDALCSLNPVYGQGVSVTAMQARLLAAVLEDGGPDLEQRFFTAADELLDGPWSLSAGNDLRFPEAIGDRSGFDPARAGYLAKVRAALGDDVEVARAFIRVAALVDPPARLASPEIAARLRHDEAA